MQETQESPRGPDLEWETELTHRLELDLEREPDQNPK